MLIAACRAFLALPPHVEQRVVDADGHPDQQHHFGDGGVDRGDVADRRHQSERRADAGDGQQHRDAGRNQRTEREDQDDERDRERQRSCLGEIIVEALVERLRGAGVAGLRNLELRMGLLSRGGGRERGADAFVGVVAVADDLELHERGMAIARDRSTITRTERRADVLDGRHDGEPSDHVANRSGELSVVRG